MDLLQPVQPQVADAGRGRVLDQVRGRATGDHGDGREPLRQPPEQLRGPPQRAGRLRVSDDRAQCAVEVHADRDLSGPRDQPSRLVGNRTHVATPNQISWACPAASSTLWS